MPHSLYETFCTLRKNKRSKITKLSVDLLVANLHEVFEETGYSILDYLAKDGHLDLLPKKYLSKKNLLHQRDDLDGGDNLLTPLQLAAEAGQLHQIPKKVFTEQSLLKADSDKCTVLMAATVHGHISQIPKDAITRKSLLKADGEGWAPIHHLAEIGEIKNFIHLLTEKDMLLKTSNGTTPLHLIASTGSIHSLLTPFLTEENLLTPDDSGETPLHKFIQKEHFPLLLPVVNFTEASRATMGEQWWSVIQDRKKSPLDASHSKPLEACIQLI